MLGSGWFQYQWFDAIRTRGFVWLKISKQFLYPSFSDTNWWQFWMGRNCIGWKIHGRCSDWGVRLSPLCADNWAKDRGFSLLNIEVNCWFRMFAFSVASSLHTHWSSVKGATHTVLLTVLYVTPKPFVTRIVPSFWCYKFVYIGPVRWS